MSLAVRRGLLVLIAVLIAEAAWILAVPPFRGVDEIPHSFRAAGVAAGQWHLTQAPSRGRGELVWVPVDLATAAAGQCKSLPYMERDDCQPVEIRDGQALIATSAGSYNPLFYWVIGTVAKPFHGANALYAMRITLALGAALLLGLATGLVTIAGSGRWATLGLVTALTPQVLFSSSLASPNGIEIDLGLVLWASLLALEGVSSEPAERSLLATAAAAAVPMSFLRAIGPLWIVCIVASVALFLGWRKTWGVLVRHRVASVLAVLAVTAGLVWSVAWSHVAAQVVAAPDAHYVKIPEQWAQAFYLHRWVLQMVAAFPFRDVPGPLWTYPLAFLVIGFLTWRALREGPRPKTLALVAILVVAAVVPIIVSVRLMPTAGAFWQGRYELPFVIGILPVCGLILDRKGYTSGEARRWVALFGVALVAVQVACVVNVEGLELARPVSRDDPAWTHPPMWVVGLLMAAACGVAALMFRERGVDPAAERQVLEIETADA